jgi:hypothetical protein
MSTKRASLASALRGVASQAEPAASVSAASGLAASTTPGDVRWARPASRVGKKTIAGHFDPAVSVQLKQIGLERDRSTQELLREAINDLFVKYGKGPIA